MERRFLVKICQMYYEEGLSQQKIADKLGVSRVKITRSLKQAKELNIIRTVIDYQGTFLKLEEKIKEKYNLKDVVIVENSINNNPITQVQKASAEYLKSCINDDDTIAVGWGNTLRGIVDYMHAYNFKNITFSPLIGGHSVDHSQIHSSNIASEMASKTGGESITINAPALVSNVEEKNTLLNNNSIASAINISEKADIAIFSLGNPLYSKSSIHSVQYFSETELQEFKKNQVICDFISIAFLDKYGNKKCKEISERSIAVSMNKLLSTPTKICLVSGTEKHESILAALRANYLDILITDNITGEFLLTEEQ